MGWPTDTEYNEAMQHPRTAFADTELQSARVECGDRLFKRMPRARSDNLAVVYRIETNSGLFTLRLFNAKGVNPKTKNRYIAINDYFATHRLQYLVKFQYISDGIRVGSQRYPVG